MAKSNSKSDKNLLKRSGFALIDSTASVLPGLAQAWALSKALFGNALQLRQQRALEWVEAISNNPTIFNERLVNSDEFQDGFVVALEDYIKLRDFLKRRVALKAFEEFAACDDKVEFPLERYNDTLRKISPVSLRALAFVKNSVLPEMEIRIKSELEQKNLGTEQPFEWWYQKELNSKPFSKYDSTGNLGKMNDQLNELEFLGLVRRVSAINGGWGFSSAGQITGWALTDFAKEFIKFIEADVKTEGNSRL
ncbi:MAG: hypothetical protein U5K77_02480 [Candidatus Saccharibacteria bacterium]|nr:hypothetical protein [Candidatus Saccharibacteria bacterium]